MGIWYETDLYRINVPVPMKFTYLVPRDRPKLSGLFK